jgi:putative ABC transport system substrate-binding protein
LGYVEGRNVAIEYRWANNEYTRLPELAADLVRQRVTVIVTWPVSAALAAKATTSTIPIVFSGDAVQAGLVTNLNRPEGNLTGINSMSAGLGAKRFGL